MPNFDNFFNQLLNDIKVSITEEFDRNFERKAFFDRPWPQAKYPAQRGSLLMRSGTLRRSILSRIVGRTIVFTSSEVYSSIQNEGGEITVSAKMKKYFWAMYYKASGSITRNASGQARRGQRNAALSMEAEYWKGMALMKVGSKIKIPERRFIGPHPQVDREVQRVATDNIHNLEAELNQMFAAQGFQVKNIRFK